MRVLILALITALLPHCAYSDPRFDPHASNVFDVSIDESVEGRFQEAEGLNSNTDLKAASEEGQNKYNPKYKARGKLKSKIIKNKKDVESTNIDSMSELSQEDQLKLQMLMDKKDKAEKTLSNTLKSLQNPMKP